MDRTLFWFVLLTLHLPHVILGGRTVLKGQRRASTGLDRRFLPDEFPIFTQREHPTTGRSGSGGGILSTVRIP